MTAEQAGIVKEEIKYNDIFSFDALMNEKHRELVHLIDCIFETNEESVDDVFKMIEAYGESLHYILNCVDYATIVRQKQRKSLLRLHFMIKKKYIDEYDDDDNETNYNEAINIFPENSVERVIMEDNIEQFIKIVSEPGFNPESPINKSDHLCFYHIDYTIDESIITYMQLMALFGSVKCFKYALMDDSFPSTDLCNFAIAGGNKEIINLLVQKGNSFDGCFESAVMFHRNELCNWLISNYKNENITLKKTQDCYNDRIFFYILKSNPMPEKNKLSRIFKYLFKVGNFQLIKYIEENTDIEFTEESTGLLAKACIQDHVEIVEHFVKKINKNVFNLTLYAACKYGKTKIVKFFVDNYKGDCFETALNYACYYGHINAVKYIINELDLDINNVNCCAPLHYAVNSGNFELVKYLTMLDDIDVNIATEKKKQRSINSFINEEDIGLVPLHIAIKNKNIEIAKYLIEECNADVKAKDSLNRNALLFAADNADLNMVKYLIKECGLDPDSCDSYGKTALYRATKNSNLELIKFLVEECHLENKTISSRVLHRACKENFIDLIKYIINNFNVDVNIKDKKEMTPLHYACDNDAIDICKYLIVDCKANTEIKNIYGYTPLDLASKSTYELLSGL